MNTRILRSLTAALVVTSVAHAATAESLGEHPAVLVAQKLEHSRDRSQYVHRPASSGSHLGQRIPDGKGQRHARYSTARGRARFSRP